MYSALDISLKSIYNHIANAVIGSSKRRNPHTERKRMLRAFCEISPKSAMSREAETF